MPIRGILFDKDGTLVDFNRTWAAVGHAMALESAAGDGSVADALMAKAGYDAATGSFRADSVFAAGTNAEIVDLWHPGLSAYERAAIVNRFDRFAAGAAAARAVPVPGGIEALRRLHAAGYRLGVATNDSTYGAEQTLLSLGIAQLFEAVYGYDAVAQPKPAPDTVSAFCDFTGLRLSEIVVIGDSRHDLEMGLSAGVAATLGVLSGTGTREALAPLADALIDSIADLPAWLGERDGRSLTS